ncbi:hypothetical protein OF83DRAFT_1154261, partial [Amylostereum chailletii]
CFMSPGSVFRVVSGFLVARRPSRHRWSLRGLGKDQLPSTQGDLLCAVCFLPGCFPSPWDDNGVPFRKFQSTWPVECGETFLIPHCGTAHSLDSFRHSWTRYLIGKAQHR